MMLISKVHGGKITVMNLERLRLYTYHYECLSHDNNLISVYSEEQLDRDFEFKGEYNKAVVLLYVK